MLRSGLPQQRDVTKHLEKGADLSSDIRKQACADLSSDIRKQACAGFENY